MVMPDETRECPVTPQELHPRDLLVHLREWLNRFLQTSVRHFGEGDQSGHPHGWAGVVIPDWDVKQRLDEIDKTLEQSREQPAVPSSTRPQELDGLLDAINGIHCHYRTHQPLGVDTVITFSRIALKYIRDLERRNAELLEHLKICVQRLYVHQGATTRKIVADAQSVIDAARGKES